MEQNGLGALDAWFQTPLGLAVSIAFKEQLLHLPTPLLSQMRGDTLLQLGACGANTWLSLLNYRKKWVFSLPTNQSSLQPINVYASPKKIPLEKESMDCIVTPLTLEVLNWEQYPIDEIDRVLKPMGYWVIFGVNTCSLWSLAMRMGWLTCYGKTKGQPISLLRLKQALLHRDYSIDYISPFYYIPPINNQKIIHHLEILNEIGKMISPAPGGFYCMIVQKYVSHLVKPIPGSIDWGRTVSQPNFQPAS